MATLLGAQASTFDLETLGGGGSSAGNLDGAKCRYVNAHSIYIEAGSLRDSADAVDIAPAAATVDVETIGAISGLDESALSATGTSSGGTDLTMSASIWSETLMSATVRTLTGTWTTVGDAMTCDGGFGRASEEIRTGDVVRSATKGACLVIQVTDNNTVTLYSGLPGGDATSESFTFYENLKIRCGSDDVRLVLTISHDGLTVYGSSDFNDAGSGKVVKIGGETQYMDFCPWAVQGSGGDGYVLSSQRTRPYSVTNYRVAWRRVPCGIMNDVSANLYPFKSTMGGRVRYHTWETSGDHSLIAGSYEGSWTYAPTNLSCPATASYMILNAAIFNTTFGATAGYAVAQFRDANSSAGPLGETGCTCGTTAGTAGTIYSPSIWMPMGPGGGFQFRLLAGGTGGFGGGGLYSGCMGWWEVS